MGAPGDQRSIVRHHPTRKSVGYFGAVRLRDGKLLTRREPPNPNAQTFWEFLIQLEEVSRVSGRQVIVISDNAKYHHALLHKDWREQKAARFRLDYLPPYSPILNPIERVWKLLRRLRLHNRYFGTLQEVVKLWNPSLSNGKNPTKSCENSASFAQTALKELRYMRNNI